MLKSFFLIFDSRKQKFDLFSIIVYQPTWETGSDRHQVRMMSPAVRRQRADVSLVVPSAPQPSVSPAASAAAVVHSSSSHCLAHTNFSTPNSRPGYRGSTTVATTYSTGAHQLRWDIKRHPTTDMLRGGPTDKPGKRLPVSPTCELKATHPELKSDTHWWNWLCFQQPYIKASNRTFTVQICYKHTGTGGRGRRRRGVNKGSDRGETGERQWSNYQKVFRWALWRSWSASL